MASDMAALVEDAADPELVLELVPELVTVREVVPKVEVELALVEVASLVAIVVVAAAIFEDAEETRSE